MTISLCFSLAALGLREFVNAFLMLYSFREQLRFNYKQLICFYLLLFLAECGLFIYLGRFGTVREMYVLGLLHVVLPFYMVKLDFSKFCFITIFITYVVILYQNLSLTLANYYTMGLPVGVAQGVYNAFFTIVTLYPCYNFLRKYQAVIATKIDWRLLLISDIIAFSYLAALLSQSHFGIIFDLRHLCTRFLILIPGMIFMHLVLQLLQQNLENTQLSENITTLESLHNTEHHYYETVLDNERDTLKLQQQLHEKAAAMLQLLDAKEYGNLEEQFDNMLLNSERLRHVNLCGHRVLDSVIGYWQLRSWEKDIDFLADIRIDTIIINDLDLAIILGNTLENAYTAASAPNIDFRQIQLKILTKGSLLLIICSNSYNGVIKQIGDEYYSSKRQFTKPGTGLNNIKIFAEKYNGYVKIKHTASKFTLNIVMTNRREI